MGYMHQLEIENFKSYKGKQLIGPMKRFTAIIGPNGSGKSNLMDAICFVLGEKTSCLRVKKIGDLIHGHPIGKPVSNRCHVTMFYREEDGTETRFTRTVIGSTSEYRIDNKIVPASYYNEQLENIKIFIKAKNFAVYQGTISGIVEKKPIDRTAMFEEMSRSLELRDKYEKLKAEMLKADGDTQFNMNKKRGIAQEKKEAKQEKEEAEKYQRMKEQLVEKQLQLHLFQLYHNEKALEVFKKEIEVKSKEINDATIAKDREDEELRAKMKEQKKFAKELMKMEAEINAMEKKVEEKKRPYQEAQMKKKHVESRLESSRKTLAAATKNLENHQKQLENGEKQMNQLQVQRDEYEEKLTQESQDLQLNLSDQQVAEYNQLAKAAGKKCSAIQSELASLTQEQELDKRQMENEKRRLVEFGTKISQKKTEIENMHKRIERVVENIERSTTQLEQKKIEFEETDAEVKVARTRLKDVTEKISDIDQQLSDARMDTAENSRTQKKQELIENLKRLFNGVHGRLVDLCQPNHKRYQLAVTKVLGKNMMAIIVDTQQTAQDCIRYMKEQRLEPETFLPLNYIDVKPINEQLRDKKEPKGVKLVYDVINVNVPQVKRALQFACGNALVCETADDARKLAFGSNERHKAVSLDGTMFQKSGVISGGASELKAKAKRWDDKVVKQLRDGREKLSEEAKELNKKRRREMEVGNMMANIRTLEHKIKMFHVDKEASEKRGLKGLNIELEQLEAEEEALEPKINEIEGRMADRGKKIEKLEHQKDGVNEEIYGDFCARVGIPNIRIYEERELRFFNEKQDKLKSYDNQLQRLKMELDFLKGEDKLGAKKKSEDNVKKLEKEVAGYEDDETKYKKELDDSLSNLEEKKEKRVEKKSECHDRDSDVTEAKRRLAAVQKRLNALEKQVNSLDAGVQIKKSERHQLLLSCKLEDIRLPLSKGSMTDVGNDDILESQDSIGSISSSQEASGSSASQTGVKEVYDREDRIKINFNKLDEDLREFTEEEEVKKQTDRLSKDVQEMTQMIQRISAPNLKADERLVGVREREIETQEEFERARKKARKAHQEFEKVKTERYDRFMKSYEGVSGKIDEIYKSLTRNQSAQAFLGADNAEEPYLDGIAYNCVVPGKRFTTMDSLSGGEKTVAALALLFAIYTHNPAPFFVLDEMDSALDNVNIAKVAAFIREETEKKAAQVIVISLKEEFYNRAEALIGIYPEPGACTVSGVLTLDLTKYRDPQGDA